MQWIKSENRVFLASFLPFLFFAACSGKDSGGADAAADTDVWDPVTISVTNATGASRYLSWGETYDESFWGAGALRCSLSADGTGDGWEDCRVTGECAHFCSELEPEDSCIMMCDPSTVVKELLPDETVEISWPGALLQEDVDYCAPDTGPCYRVIPAPTALYRFAIHVYDTVECGQESCTPTEEGFLFDVYTPGVSNQYAVEFSLPAPAAVYDIELASPDAGTPCLSAAMR